MIMGAPFFLSPNNEGVIPVAIESGRANGLLIPVESEEAVVASSSID